MKKRAIVFVLMLIVAVAAFVAFFVGWFVVAQGQEIKIYPQHPPFQYLEQVTSDAPIYSHGLHSVEFFDNAYDRAGEPGRVETRSAIVAHHLLVADKVAEVFEQLAVSSRATVFVIGPNHFSNGVSSAQVSFGTWSTPYGEVQTDVGAANLLLEQSMVVQSEETAASEEHSIGALTPFIARSFPHAKIVPIIVHESLEKEDAEKLGETIAMLFPDAAVVASVDMSHNLPASVASYHDEVTKRALLGGSAGEVQLEIDSNATLNVLQAYNRASGTEALTITHHDNSFAMNATDDWRENTSHILGYFTYGAPVDAPNASLHFVGDIMLDRGVRRLMNENGVDYPWKEMVRFLSGSHLSVGNLEGTVSERASAYTYDPPFRFVFSPDAVKEMGKFIDVVSLANNHSSDVGSAGLRETEKWLDDLDVGWFSGFSTPVPRFDGSINGIDVAMIGYHAFQPNKEELQKTIAAADDEGRFVIVLPHWGAEYVNAPTSSQRKLAEQMVEYGADLIIGSHAHVPQGIEIIDDVPVVYSLGNFVFDQQIPETWGALTVGVIVEEDRVIMHLLPVNTRDGQPTPLDPLEEQELLDLVASHSDEGLAESIHSGTIMQTYVR